jgi:predicted signal transduction protein with EAL and GGDEF domain
VRYIRRTAEVQGASQTLMPLGIIGREELTGELQDSLVEANDRGKPLALFWLAVGEADGERNHRPPSSSLLRHCAERIAARLREGDVIGYMGGGEFAVLVNSIHHPAEAISYARSILCRSTPRSSSALPSTLLTATSRSGCCGQRSRRRGRPAASTGVAAPGWSLALKP